MLEHPTKINRNNVDAFVRYIRNEFFHNSWCWDKLTNNVQISRSLYVSVNCDYTTDSAFYYDTTRHAPCNTFNGDELSGTIYRLITGKGKTLGVMIGERNLVWFIMLDSPHNSDMKMVAWACRKISSVYKTPVIRINLNLSARCLLYTYGMDFKPDIYPHIPTESISKYSTAHEICVKPVYTRSWSNDATPVYTIPMFNRLNELNGVLHRSGHSFEVRIS